ncbi:MAG: RS21-C6 protein [Armatimonadetes bacterium]|nr:RS21-C6 protein [Armatimonadota bacterium]
MATIPETATLPELQAYVAQACRERGWDRATDLECFLLFVEEVGELARAIRRRRNLFDEKGKARDEGELAEELADLLSYLLDLSNRLGVDLEEAFRAKEERNLGREWS